jgi:heme/copper-type cytochrome/quinol oxidase subunit 2
MKCSKCEAEIESGEEDEFGIWTGIMVLIIFVFVFVLGVMFGFVCAMSMMGY